MKLFKNIYLKQNEDLDEMQNLDEMETYPRDSRAANGKRSLL